MPENKIKLFVSHASEDKVTFVEPLVDALRQHFEVWYDKYVLKIGDSLRDSIDRGLREADYGVVVLSPNFFHVKKVWTANELNALFALETSSRKIILPIWLHVGRDEVAKYSPMLADRLGCDASKGVAWVVDQIRAKVEGSEQQKSLHVDPIDAMMQSMLSKISQQEINENLSRRQEGVQLYTQALEKIEKIIRARFETHSHFRCSKENDHVFRVSGPNGLYLEISGRNNLFINSVSHVNFEIVVVAMDNFSSLINARRTLLTSIVPKPFFISENEVRFSINQSLVTVDELATKAIEAYCSQIEHSLKRK